MPPLQRAGHSGLLLSIKLLPTLPYGVLAWVFVQFGALYGGEAVGYMCSAYPRVAVILSGVEMGRNASVK